MYIGLIQDNKLEIFGFKLACRLGPFPKKNHRLDAYLCTLQTTFPWQANWWGTGKLRPLKCAQRIHQENNTSDAAAFLPLSLFYNCRKYLMNQVALHLEFGIG